MNLEIFQERQGELVLIGNLETLSGSGEQFTYDNEYLFSNETYALSQSLPKRETPFMAVDARPYFEGLLPEGRARQAVARKLGVKSSSYLKILSEMGGECIGDIIIAPKGASWEDVVPAYVPIEFSSLEDIAREGASAAAELQTRSRLSLAGAQMKSGLYHAPHASDAEGWYLPLNSAPSTHIVKFANRDFPELIINEWLCMTVAGMLGIDVPVITLLPTESPLLCIERYDREFVEGDNRFASGQRLPTRLHQEDLCQALGVLSDHKYDEQHWGGFSGITDFLVQRSIDPVADLYALARVTLFNFLIGNCDNHLKNLSILYAQDWQTFKLAPNYDLVSTVVFERLERTMAMTIGEHKHIDRITPGDISLLAKSIGISAQLAFEQGSLMASQLEKAFDTAALELEKAGHAAAFEIAERICEQAASRITVFK